MKNRWLLVISIVLVTLPTFAQKLVKGVVLEQTRNGKYLPLVSAPVTWLANNQGTVTDSSGVFILEVSEDFLASKPKLVVSYIGFQSDTITITDTEKIKVILSESSALQLKEIEVNERIHSSYINSLDPQNTITMIEKELFKAACCNLSESFETNPVVDVSYADAVTGAKQIQMLGLSGLYTQINYENMPGVRGLAGIYGLAYTPGPWIESIQITKGVGSVANGFENMVGQINVELKKPDVNSKTGEQVYFNAYANDMGRYEGSVNLAQKISPKWSTITLLHANGNNHVVDMNHDGFLDIPQGYQLNFVNRWKYKHNNMIVQFGLRALRDQRFGGQYKSAHAFHHHNTDLYTTNFDSERLEVFAKIGYVFPQHKYKSIGLIINANQHNQNNSWGGDANPNTYRGVGRSLHANLIYQSIIGNTNHKYRIGTGVATDALAESIYEQNFNRTEVVPGIFGEYTWTALTRLTLIAGLRADYHNLYGAFVTPRVHGKFDISEKTYLRFSAGRGQRTPNLVADNFAYFISARTLVLDNNPNINAIESVNSNNAFAANVKPEVSWNYGISLVQEFRLNYRKGNFNIDFYRTDFQNQWVIDLDQNPRVLNMYNLRGRSFSNSLQTELSYEIAKKLDLKLAYRFYDVQTTYNGQLLERPFVSRHRAFANLAYETKSKWMFDVTINWNGPKRLPNTNSNPAEDRLPAYSPSFFLVNAQIAKSFGSPKAVWWDLYIGAENLTDFRQHQLILSATNPFSPSFDAAMVWGPVIGRMFYGGIRFKIK
jgi:outer membrane receptor for ferrienterochelin and colicin